MERKRQLSNVAFGGDWSEGIEPAEQIAAALLTLEQAVERARNQNPLTSSVLQALNVLTDQIARGEMQRAAFVGAAKIPHPEIRLAELRRVLKAIRSLVGKEGAGA